MSIWFILRDLTRKQCFLPCLLWESKTRTQCFLVFQSSGDKVIILIRGISIFKKYMHGWGTVYTLIPYIRYSISGEDIVEIDLTQTPSTEEDAETEPAMRKRRRRVLFTKTQTQELEKRFREQRYLSAPEREELSKVINLTPTQIKIWYQNHRYKFKRQRTESDALNRLQFFSAAQVRAVPWHFPIYRHYPCCTVGHRGNMTAYNRTYQWPSQQIYYSRLNACSSHPGLSYRYCS